MVLCKCWKLQLKFWLKDESIVMHYGPTMMVLVLDEGIALPSKPTMIIFVL
jgi:hypothetical protein